MNSKSKRKWVAGGLAAFASVALLTTGFATWIVGTNKMDVNNKTTVNVATAQNASIELSMVITPENSKIRFAETSVPDADAFVRVDEGGANGDLTLNFTSIKVTYGVDSGFDPSQYKLAFTVTEIMKGGSSVKETANKVALTTFDRASDSYSYFQAPADIPLNSTNGTTATNDERTVSTYTFKTQALDIPFRWGTAFGNTASGDENQSPATFYNNYFKGHQSEKTAANAEIVRSELAAMYTALNDATITLEAKLSKISQH